MNKIKIDYEMDMVDPRLKVKDTTLPEYPSELLKLALNDIAVVKKSKRYRINTNVWHSPNVVTCSVCLAGAVLANTLKSCSFVNLITTSLKFKYIGGENGRDNCTKLEYIELLRQLELRAVYYDFRNTLKQKNITGEEMEIVTGVRNKILKKLDKITTSNYSSKDVFSFKNFKLSHKFYSSIVDDLAYLDTSILGMENTCKTKRRK